MTGVTYKFELIDQVQSTAVQHERVFILVTNHDQTAVGTPRTILRISDLWRQRQVSFFNVLTACRVIFQSLSRSSIIQFGYQI